MIYKPGLGDAAGTTPSAAPASFITDIGNTLIGIDNSFGSALIAGYNSLDNAVTGILSPYQQSGTNSALDAYSQAMYDYVPDASLITVPTPVAPSTQAQQTNPGTFTPDDTTSPNMNSNMINTNTTTPSIGSTIWILAALGLVFYIATK
jgi:hypothetical protein